MEQVVIVGAGQPGHCTAFELRRQNYKGRILLVGEEALAPYERPPLSKAAISTAETPAPTYFSPAQRYADQNIELMLAERVEAIERSGWLHLTNGNRVPYDHLVLATGGRVRRLDIEGGEHVFCLREWSDAQLIRSRLRGGTDVVCVGGGVIGLEIAAAASQFGCRVTVVEAGRTVMGRCLAPEEAAIVEHRHRAAGVMVHFGRSLLRVQPVGDRFNVIMADGEEIVADLVTAGIGMMRNTQLAQSTGLAVDNGIFVDRFARTEDPAIYAAGDVAACEHALYPGRLRLESWYHAQYHGACAARSIAGVGRPYDDIPRFWTDQYDLNIQVAGFPAGAVNSVTVGDPTTNAFTVLHADGDGRLVAVTAINQPRSMRPAIEAIRRGNSATPSVLSSTTARVGA